ncbi:hypothetical protein DNTS_011370 [Danionella cerebrum]|uniref:T-box domain-containing protein n=1 Tax=Danionella cerebrum TaxID=2873325 RepID=A0A553QWV1_9TELE|nr:hypothetical protein DNTS_011370 [Danionella translucida]
MYLAEERSVLESPYQINNLHNNYGYYPQDCRDPAMRTQPVRMNPAEAELTSLPVHVSLQERELWDKFSNIGTEMLITKSGRRMFPGCKLTVTGLNPKVMYVVIMDMVPFDNHKYKWNKDCWETNGSADPHLPNRFFIHPDSPAPGEKWMQYPISFHKLKLTNNTLNSSGLVVLHSLHKYQPRLHIIQSPDPCSPHNPGAYLRFSFPEAAFIAVTAYQNQEITKLKIDYNPFAKGFRDNGLNRKRFRDKMTQVNQETNGHKQVATPNQQSISQKDEDVTVSSSGDSSSISPNHFPSASNTATVLQTHNIQNFTSTLANSPRTAMPSSHGLCTALPVSQSSCNTSLPSPSTQHHFQLPPPHSHTGPSEAEQPLSLPPKLSRMSLPESTLRNLDMNQLSEHATPTPFANILNRIQFRALVAGPPVKVLPQHPQLEHFLHGAEREPRSQMYPTVHQYTDQQFTMNSQTEPRAMMNYASVRPLTQFYCQLQTGK